MDSYRDNLSPEPSGPSLTNDCYKTPDIQQYQLNSALNLNQLYPTPPSDNEDTCTTSSYDTSDHHVTPKTTISPNDLGNHYMLNKCTPNEHEAPNFAFQTQSVNYPGAEGIINSIQPSSNRYKRRSRTTYSKSQLDILESTFQKTHYPEIRMVDDLSQMLNLSTERISIWFQNRRARFKKARKLENVSTQSEFVPTPTQSQFKYELPGQYFNPTPIYPSMSLYPSETNLNLNKPLVNVTNQMPATHNYFNMTPSHLTQPNANLASSYSPSSQFNSSAPVNYYQSNGLNYSASGLPFMTDYGIHSSYANTSNCYQQQKIQS